MEQTERIDGEKVKLPPCADDWCSQCGGVGMVKWEGEVVECPSCLGAGYPLVG